MQMARRYNDLVEDIDNLDLEEMEALYELIHKRIIEERRAQVLSAEAEVMENYKKGNVKTGTAAEIIAYMKQ